MTTNSRLAAIAVLLLLVISTASGQFREIERVNLQNEFEIANAYGIATNDDEGLIFVMILRTNTIITLDEEEYEEVGERLFLDGPRDVYGMDYNAEDNTFWCADRSGAPAFIYHFARDGELLDSFNPGGDANGVCVCPENGDLYVACHPGGIIRMTQDGEVVERWANLGSLTAIDYYPPNNTLLSMLGNDAINEFSLDGELIGVVMQAGGMPGNGLGLDYNPWDRILYTTWINAGIQVWEDNFGALAEPEISPAEFDIQVPFGAEGSDTLTIANVGEEDSRLFFHVWDEGEGVDWLAIDPESGSLPEGESTEVILSISTENLEPIQYERLIVVSSNNPEFRRVEIPVQLIVIAGWGELRGTVTDFGNDEPVEGAVVFVEILNVEEVTDENGVYHFERLPEWSFNVRLTAEDFLPQRVEDVEIIEDEVTVLDFELLHSVCALSRNVVNEVLPPEEETEIDITLSNPGNGPLTWSVDLDFPDNLEVEPWEHRAEFAVADLVDNNRLGGIEFVGDHYYISGGIRGEDNPVYIVDRDFRLVDQFPQFIESNYGIRDLTYGDGLLWGIDGDQVFGFTTDGELDVQFETPIAARCITWDPVNSHLWMCNLTSDFVAVNTSGELVAELDRPDEQLHIYGIGWYPEDTDGFYIYMFCADGEFNRQIYKMNPENGDVQFLHEPLIEVQAGAMTVTQRWDPYGWVVLALSRANPMSIQVWHIAAPSGWVDIAPTEGVLEPGGDTGLALTLNSRGLPFDLEFNVDLVFTHDGEGGENRIPVTLLATEGNVQTSRTLELDIGWNMVSVNVDPDTNDVMALTRDLVDNELLAMMKDRDGNFYLPDADFCNIPGWFVEQGYQMKVFQACELEIEGLSVMADDIIPLRQGWQIVSYYPRVDVDAMIALSGIADDLLIAKDGFGNFYIPAWDFSNMGDLTEGQGYQLKMESEGELVYRLVEEELASVSLPRNIGPELLPVIQPTGSNMSMLVVMEGGQPVSGYSSREMEVGVYTSGVLVGTGRFFRNKCGIAVWGDDPSTPAIDGAEEGDLLEVKLADNNGVRDVDFITLAGSGVYHQDDIWVVSISETPTVPGVFGIQSVYPNPFNDAARITFELPQQSEVRLALYEPGGREISRLASGVFNAGVYNVMLDGSKIASGIYFVRLEAGKQAAWRKVALVK